MCHCSFVLYFALLTSAVPLVCPQTATQTSSDSTATLKTKARLVLVDVVVTNDKGDPVTGLQKKDFEVFEDGQPQTISTFEEHRGAPITQIQMPPLPPHVFTNFPLVQAADSVNIILLDALNTPSRDQLYVRSQMLKYLKTIPPGHAGRRFHPRLPIAHVAGRDHGLERVDCRPQHHESRSTVATAPLRRRKRRQPTPRRLPGRKKIWDHRPRISPTPPSIPFRPPSNSSPTRQLFRRSSASASPSKPCSSWPAIYPAFPVART